MMRYLSLKLRSDSHPWQRSVLHLVFTTLCAVFLLTGISSNPIIWVSAEPTPSVRERPHLPHDIRKFFWGRSASKKIDQQKISNYGESSLAKETITGFSQIGIDRTAPKSSIEQQHTHQHLRRKTMYLPPAPVTPFRGGLKSVPNDDDDDDLDDQEDISNIESSEDSVEARSSDNDSQRRDPGGQFSTSSVNRYPGGHFHSNNELGISSWAPEDYPDPWTNPILCGGAATASLMDNGQYQEDPQSYSHSDLSVGKTPQQADNRRPLFCDPDQVLDKETLRNVAVKLRSFAENFALSGVMEGGDFGIDNAEDGHDNILNDNREASDQNQENSVQSDKVDQQSHLFRKQRLDFEKGMHSDSVGGIFSATHRGTAELKKELEEHRVEVAIALVQKINLPAILRPDSYFFYSDQDDMVNDAAQYFARYIHDTWSKRLAQEQKASNDDASTPTSLVLIFISTVDRICYISSGTHISAILPWWRLEHVVEDMKLDLRKGQTGDALYVAIEDLTALLLEGPPSLTDRVNDFFARFGMLMLFTIFTFVFATWGECRDRRKRLFFVERRSQMTAAEKEKARLLQKQFKTKTCPICLEPFGVTPEKDHDTCTNSEEEKSLDNQEQTMKRVDSYDIPLFGSDDQPIKMLRCGHIFDKTCWQMWTDSGHGNPYICPVCRQDVGRPKKGSNRSGEGGTEDNARGNNEEERPNPEESSLFTRIVAHTTGPSMLLAGPASHAQPNYNSIQPRIGSTPFAPLSYPTLRRLNPMFGAPMSPPQDRPGEQTPLFAQASSTSNEDEVDFFGC